MVDYAANTFGTCIPSTRERKRTVGPAKDTAKKYWPAEGQGSKPPAKLYKSEACLHTGLRSSTLEATGTRWQLCRMKTNSNEGRTFAPPTPPPLQKCPWVPASKV